MKRKSSIINKIYNPTYKLLYTLIYILNTILVVYLITYILWVYPLNQLHNLQSKQWISDLTDKLIVGTKNAEVLKPLNKDKGFVSYWYCYWQIHTAKYTIFILFHYQNKYSNRIKGDIYLYDYTTQKVLQGTSIVGMKELQTYKKDNKIYIDSSDDNHTYFQEIDFVNNKSTIYMNTSTIKLELNVNIEDYTTNQLSFIPRYRMMHNLIRTDAKETYSPDEWFSDNPFIGKVTRCVVNGDKVETAGTFWFDNFIGKNNAYLSPYIWFVVNNEDWLIYLLWFGEEGTQDNLDTKKPIIIKDKKRNKILYAGSDGHAPSIYRPLKNIVTPINMTYKTQSKLGDSKYDNYTILFESNDFVYKCKSIPGQSVQVYIDDYYNSGDVDIQKLQGWDKQYYETLLNIKYVEYVNMAEHEITYMGKTVKFTDRQVIDAKYSINPNKPSTIRWSK